MIQLLYDFNIYDRVFLYIRTNYFCFCADFLADLTVFLAVEFLTDFLVVDCLTDFLAVEFLTDFLADGVALTDFLAVEFLTDFFADGVALTDFLAVEALTGVALTDFCADCLTGVALVALAILIDLI